MIISENIHINLSTQKLHGFNGTETIEDLKSSLLKEFNFYQQNRLEKEIAANNNDNDDDDDDEEGVTQQEEIVANVISAQRKWIKVGQGNVDYLWEVEECSELVFENDSDYKIKEKQYLLIKDLDQKGYAYKKLKLNVGDKIYGIGTEKGKSTRYTTEEILDYIENAKTLDIEDNAKRKENKVNRRETQVAKGNGAKKLASMKKNEKEEFARSLSFKPFTLCVMGNGDISNMDMESKEDRKNAKALGETELKQKARVENLLQNNLATGYFQVIINVYTIFNMSDITITYILGKISCFGYSWCRYFNIRSNFKIYSC